MKFINKSVLAVAVVGALVSGNAMAKAEILTSNTVYAKEIALPATLTVPVQWELGYNFNTNETRYACVRLDGAVLPSTVASPKVWKSAAVVGGVDPDDLSENLTACVVNVVDGGSANSSVAFFTLSSSDSNTAIGATLGEVIDLSAIAMQVISYSDTVTATVGLYDNPSAAGVCTGANTNQLIPNTLDKEDLISFKKSYSFSIDPNKLLASVEADPSFSAFAASPVVYNGDAWLNTIELALVTNPGLVADGSRTITLADIFPTSSTITLNGDFSWANAVKIDYGNGTATLTGNDEKATGALNLTTDFYGSTIVTPGQVDADGNPVEIPAGAYTAELRVVPNTGYTLKEDGTAGAVTLIPTYDEALVANDNSVDSALQVNGSAGQIDQDGVRLMTPLVQLAGGQWLARLAISNTGSKDREFSLKVQGFDSEGDSSTVTVKGDNKYVVKAGTTYVFDDLTNTLEFTGRARGTVTAIVAAPETEIKGVYQLVNTGANTISNINMINQTGGQGH